jgi:hypothetical protein
MAVPLYQSSKAKFSFTITFANHLVDMDLTFLQNFGIINLISKSVRVIQSYTRQISNLTDLDLAYTIQSELFGFPISKSGSSAFCSFQSMLTDIPSFSLARIPCFFLAG